MKRLRWFESFTLVLMLVAVILCYGRLVEDDSIVFRKEAAGATRITLADCPVKEEAIDNYLGVRRSYTFELPSNLAADDCLVLNITHQYCSVRVGRETRYVYEEGSQNFVHTSGRYWACVRLSSSDASKTVEVQLTPVFRGIPEPEISVCPLDRVIYETLKADLPLLILGSLCLILGLSLVVIPLFTDFDNLTKQSLFCLVVLTISAGVWKISSLPIVTLLLYSAQTPLLQPKAVYVYYMVSFLVMSVFIIQYIIGMSRNRKGVAERVCSIVITLSSFVALVLQLMGLVELQIVVPYLMVESGVLMLIMFSLILIRRQTLWLTYFPICGVADLLITAATGKARYAVFLMLCIMVSDYVSSVSFVRRTIRQRSELRDARTMALLNQIHPHFIHNTLTSIYYLCDSDPQTAKHLVHDFNSYLRANFSSMSVKTPIRFSEEMENVRAYLSVEQVRFSDKLLVEYDTPHTAFRLPALTLQPLVENAVKHNVDSSKPPVHIRIRSFKTDDGSKVVIEDDGVNEGETVDIDVDGETPDKHEHVGLRNVADRLEILCGGTLTVSHRDGGGTIATVFIPDA